MKRVCIVGAGTSGLCSARHALENSLKVTIFEQSSQIGGTWVFDKNIGICNGIDVHSSMYEDLRTNLPKEVMGFPDFKIVGCEESYVPSQKICSFLDEYADHFNLKQHVKFNSYVIRIHPIKNKWQVFVKNLRTNQVEINYFDYVMVANGHYHTPRYPEISGGHRYKGLCLHSHDYRRRNIFAGKSVLVIGAGPSGMDLSNIIGSVASCVVLSHHLKEIECTKFLPNVYQKPDVSEFDEKGAYFTDGSYAEFDAILLCTGFKYAFPFLTVDCGIYVEDNFVQTLFKHCINIKNPTMALIGIPFYVCAAQMMDLQARFALKYFSCPESLPSAEEMLTDNKTEMQCRWSNGYKRRQAHMMGPEQINYYNDLSNIANLKNIPPVMTKLHNESSKCFNNNLLHFRDDIFRIINNDTFIKIN